MDLVEIRKKARLQPLKLQSHQQVEPQLAAGAPDIAGSAPLLPITPVESRAQSLLQSYFPGLTLATEEDYIQGLSAREQGVAEETLQWLTFLLGDEEYAVSLDVVLELIKPRAYTELPKVPADIKGILSLRGVVVPIIDLRLRLKLGPAEEDSYQRIIICAGAEQTIGILVDRITQVVRVAKSCLESTPLALSDLEKKFVAGVGRYQGRMLILLNPDEILKV